MKPDTSRWRDSRTYDYFDDLSVEGLAWECLRRDHAYQEAYYALIDTGKTGQPLPAEAEQLWGLRFCREAFAARDPSDGSLVRPPQSRRHCTHRTSRASAK